MSSVKTQVFNTKKEASVYVAQQIQQLISSNNLSGKRTVLGLATGSSPIVMYQELIRMHQEEGLSFKNVISFNLDEYFPMKPEALESYHFFMNHNLFDHIDIDKNNVYLPKGTLNESEVDQFCLEYENKIKEAGGIDIQILGIGRTGHVGFNEPGSKEDSITRMVILNKVTIADAVNDFGSEDLVPKKAITMGVSTILNAKKIFLMAWGEKKAKIVAESLLNLISEEVPATYLQKHSNVEYVLDKEASGVISLSK